MLKDNSAMTSTVQELQQHFKIYDLGPTFFLLITQIKQDLIACFVSLSQSYYINEPLKHFGIGDYIPIKTSLSPEIDLSGLVPMPFEQSKIKSVSYLSAVDSLQYLTTITQLDIYFAT